MQDHDENGLELFGLTATGQSGGITGTMWEGLEKEMDELVAFVAEAKHVFTGTLEKFAEDIRTGRIRL